MSQLYRRYEKYPMTQVANDNTYKATGFIDRGDFRGELGMLTTVDKG